MQGPGKKAGIEVGKYVRQAIREAVARAEKLLTEQELNVSLGGLDVPLLKDLSLRIGLEPKKLEPKQ